MGSYGTRFLMRAWRAENQGKTIREKDRSFLIICKKSYPQVKTEKMTMKKKERMLESGG
jgi:hypothetical protein